MPTPVAGAILIFVTSFMVLSGIQIILPSRVDREVFVVGVAFVFGLSLDILPGLYARRAGWVRPLFSSSLTLATVIAVVLNQVLRIRPAAAPTAASH